MSNTLGIIEKISNIQDKLYLYLARKHYKPIRYEIKVEGIDTGISIYRKDIYKLNIHKVLVAGLISILVGFNALMKPTIISSAYDILAYIKPEYQIIGVFLIVYSLYKKEIYCFAYYETLSEAMKEYNEQKLIINTKDDIKDDIKDNIEHINN